jgi:excisionase family DNA binding protein
VFTFFLDLRALALMFPNTKAGRGLEVVRERKVSFLDKQLRTAKKMKKASGLGPLSCPGGNFQERSRQPLNAAVLANMKLADQIEGMASALTVAQLANLLQCSRKALYKMLQKGTLPHFRVGSMVRFDPEVTAHWLRSRSAGKHH